MKNLFFELKYYLLFLIIFVVLFIGIIFSPKISISSDNQEFIQKEVVREKVLFSDDRLSLEVDTNDVVQIFEIKKNDTLLNLLKESNIKDVYIRTLIKTSGSEKLAQIKVGDILEVKKTISGEPVEIFLTTNELDGILATYKNGLFKIQNFSRPLEKLERFASVTINNSLYESAVREGLSDSLIMDLVYLFGWDIDFIFDIRPGD